MENSASTGSRVTQGSEGGAGNQKKEKVLHQAGGQLRGGARGVLARHKNVSCRSYDKKSWLKRKRKRIGTIGLTVLGP
jgi:hypothetical protein